MGTANCDDDKKITPGKDDFDDDVDDDEDGSDHKTTTAS